MKLDQLGRTPHLPSRVAEMLLREITEGRLKPGDRLPTEQFLAGSFGVSRNVVREAIARLRSEGLVQARQGVGAFVTQRQDKITLRFDAESLSESGAFANVFELRAILEIRAAGLAARRGTDTHFAELTAALDRMRGTDKWADAGVDADLAFHRIIALATGNAYIARVIGFVAEQVRESIMATRGRASTVGEIIEITIQEHVAIHDALLSRSAEASREAMSTHIRNAAGRLGLELSEDRGFY